MRSSRSPASFRNDDDRFTCPPLCAAAADLGVVHASAAAGSCFDGPVQWLQGNDRETLTAMIVSAHEP